MDFEENTEINYIWGDKMKTDREMLGACIKSEIAKIFTEKFSGGVIKNENWVEDNSMDNIFLDNNVNNMNESPDSSQQEQIIPKSKIMIPDLSESEIQMLLKPDFSRDCLKNRGKPYNMFNFSLFREVTSCPTDTGEDIRRFSIVCGGGGKLRKKYSETLQGDRDG